MDRWDVFIILVAGYLAVMALVRLMARRRGQMVGRVRQQVAEHRKNHPPAKKPVKKADHEAA